MDIQRRFIYNVSMGNKFNNMVTWLGAVYSFGHSIFKAGVKFLELSRTSRTISTLGVRIDLVS